MKTCVLAFAAQSFAGDLSPEVGPMKRLGQFLQESHLRGVGRLMCSPCPLSQQLAAATARQLIVECSISDGLREFDPRRETKLDAQARVVASLRSIGEHSADLMVFTHPEIASLFRSHHLEGMYPHEERGLDEQYFVFPSLRPDLMGRWCDLDDLLINPNAITVG